MKKETPEEKRARLLSKAKESVGNAYAGSEHAVIQAINSYLEVEKVRNLLYERIEEWYGMYFPELRVGSQSTLVKFITRFGGNKKDAKQEEVKELMGDKTNEVLNQIKNSIGREPSGDEFETLKTLAESDLMLMKTEERIDEYLSKSTKELMPNITHLVDYKVAAELLSKAGSLERLAMMPASTVQLLGAEKALFKHLRYGSKPPKYGVLFKLPQIATAGKKQRGRMARIYATKITIAAKADAFSKKFIADKLKADLEKRMKMLQSQKS